MIPRINDATAAGGLSGGQTDSNDDGGDVPDGMGGSMDGIGGMGNMGGAMRASQ